MSGLLALWILLYPIVMTAYLTAKFTSGEEVKYADSSIGVIGGADGPTVILISEDDGRTAVRYASAALCMIIGVIFAVLFYKSKKKEKVNE